MPFAAPFLLLVLSDFQDTVRAGPAAVLEKFEDLNHDDDPECGATRADYHPGQEPTR
jgi:hypothetical protein